MTKTEARIIRDQIEDSASGASDEKALTQIWMYPPWNDHADYKVGDRVQYKGKLYKCRMEHPALPSWTPSRTPALWTEVTEQSGTRDNPITYDGNMELVEGLYYSQNGIVYICIRSTGVPVFNELKDLVGIYVEVAV